MNRLALRNLFRHRVRSIVALGAIAFSTIVLAIAAGFAEQIFRDLRELTIEAGLGHIQIVRQGYLAHGVANPYDYLLPKDAPELARIAEAPNVVEIGSRLNFSGLISVRDSSLSFVGVGVEPDKEKIVSRNLTFRSGSDLDARSVNEVVVGEGLAGNLGLKTGDTVGLVVNTATGGVNALEATVRGVYTTQVKAFDDVAIRVPLAAARKLLRTTGSHVWVVALDASDRTDATAAVLKSTLDPKRFEVVRWVDLADAYTKTVTFMRGELGVVRLLMAMIVVLGVSNMLIMNVLERTGEVGTLMAMGNRRRRVVAMFLIESLYLGLIGGAVGIVASFVLAKIITAIGIPMPPPPGRTADYVGGILLTRTDLLGAFLIAIATTAIAALYPAYKASRLVIVDALRHNR